MQAPGATGAWVVVGWADRFASEHCGNVVSDECLPYFARVVCACWSASHSAFYPTPDDTPSVKESVGLGQRPLLPSWLVRVGM